MNSCARVLISKILLPSLVNVGMMGLVQPALTPAAAAPPGSANHLIGVSGGVVYFIACIVV